MTSCLICGKIVRTNATECTAAWLATEGALSDDSFDWTLVLSLEADLLIRPERKYLALLIRYLTMVRDLPEATFANLFKDAVQSLTTPELQELYRHAFESKSETALRVGWQRWPCARCCGEILARMKSQPRASQMAVIPSGIAADHLVVVLRILARSNAALGEDIAILTLPTVSRIISNMEITSPFRLLMQAVE